MTRGKGKCFLLNTYGDRSRFRELGIDTLITTYDRHHITGHPEGNEEGMTRGHFPEQPLPHKYLTKAAFADPQRIQAVAEDHYQFQQEGRSRVRGPPRPGTLSSRLKVFERDIVPFNATKY